MLKILEELQSLIPPLSIEEKNTLEASLLADGCRDPLVVWNDIIVDGHNRYEICQRNNIQFETATHDFADIDTVKVWMIDNQKGRRNLTDGWKFELAQVRKALLAKRGRENIVAAQKERRAKEQGIVSLSETDKDRQHNTQREIAKDLGWSTGKVAMADRVWERAAPEVKEQIKAGEVSINQAYTQIRKEEKKLERAAEIEKQREAISSGEIQLPPGLFEVVVMDPPWNYGREYDPDGSRVANPYPEMSQAELLEMAPPFADDCVLFLWTTHRFLFDAKSLLDSWGFNYKASLVWDKEKIGMGRWLRMQCEFCLLGIRGKPSWDNTTWRDIIREGRREHSRKPDAFYQMVEDITTGRRLDYFSRQAREGWECYGNDTEKF